MTTQVSPAAFTGFILAAALVVALAAAPLMNVAAQIIA